MRLALFALLFGLGTAQAQDAELGVRYWYSGGTTTRSHNAQGLAPSLGNPTSVLTYEDVNAHALELHGRKSFPSGWFVKGNAGLGTITGGSFDDEDFQRGQVKFSDTTSTVKGNNLGYATLDLGYTLSRTSAGWAGLFVGYHYWRERLDAYGVIFTLANPPIIDEPESVPAITNEVTWQSLRIGFASSARLGPSSWFSADVALVPYARVRDEDSHWLRQNPGPFFLGPAPNIHIEGRGYGFQLDLELRQELQADWEAGAGLRYWWLRAEDGTRKALTTSVPIVEVESRRFGIMLSLTRRW